MNNLELDSGIQTPMGYDNSQPNINIVVVYKGLTGSARRYFISKVYIMLGVLYSVSAIMCFVSGFSNAFIDFLYYNQWFAGLCGAIMIASQLIILFVPASRKNPYDLIIFVLFTLAYSIEMSFFSDFIIIRFESVAIMVASCMTLAVMMALTPYALFTQEDFTTKRGVIIVFFSLIPTLLLCILCYYRLLGDYLFSFFGIAVFGIYMVVDVQGLVVKNRRLQLSMDDYISGSILIHIDFIVYLVESCMK